MIVGFEGIVDNVIIIGTDNQSSSEIIPVHERGNHSKACDQTTADHPIWSTAIT